MFNNTRRRIIACVVVGLIVLFGVVGYTVVPGLVRSMIEDRMSAQLGRRLQVAAIDVHPYRLGLTLSELSIAEADGQGSMVHIGTVDVAVSPVSLLRLAPVVNHLTIDQPTVHILRSAPQRFNFSDIVERLAAQPSSGGHAEFSINNVRLTAGTIVFDDQVTGSQHRIDELNLSLPTISNIRHDIERDALPALSMRVDGSPIRLTAKTKPFEKSLDTSLSLDINALDLTRYLGFVPVTIKPHLTSAILSGTVDVNFSRSGTAAQQLGLSGRLVIDHLAVTHPGGQAAIAADRIVLAMRDVDPFAPTVDLDALIIDHPEVSLERGHDGRIDLVELFASDPTHPGAPGEKPPVMVDKGAQAAAPSTLHFHLASLAVHDGIVHYHDDALARGWGTSVSKVGLEMSNVTTDANSSAAFKFQASLEGDGQVSLNGVVHPAERAAELDIQGESIALAPFEALAAPYFGGRLESGRLKAGAHLAVATVPSVSLVVTAGTAGIDDLKIAPGNSHDSLIRVAHAAVGESTFDLSHRTLAIGQVTLEGGDLNVVRDTAGSLNLQALARPTGERPLEHPVPGAAAKHEAALTESPSRAPVQASTQAAPDSGHAPEISVAGVEVSGVTLHYRDVALPDKTAVTLSGVALSAHAVHLGRGARIPFRFSAEANRRGRIEVAGDVTPEPLALVAHVSAQRLPLAVLQAYAPGRLNVTITSADLTLRGDARYNANGQAHFTGTLSVSDFAALDRVTGADFLSWKSLDVSSLAVDVPGSGRAPLVQVGDVALGDFYSRLIIYPNGRLNVQDIMASTGAAPPRSLTSANPDEVQAGAQPVMPPAAASAPASTSSQAVPPPATGTTSATSTSTALVPASQATPSAAPSAAPAAIIRVKSISLKAGSINYTDNFVRPNYSTSISQLIGSVSAVASDAAQPADVKLSGSLEGNGELEASGKINPLARPLFLDLSASATNIELTRLSTYSVKYAGYNIERGKLSMNVKYHIENGQLRAENHLFLDQLTFGDHVDNMTATKLPVLLAVSLLKNSRGEIDVNLPVSGSLSDPQFSIGGVIVRVILNLLERALVSPFSLLSSIGGPSGEDLGHVQFAPGQADIAPAEATKIDHLVSVLADRPALKLDIIGRADRGADADAARAARLAARVRGQKFREILKKDDTTSFDAVVVAPEEYPRYLEAVYRDMDFAKPTNAIGLTKSLPVAEMESLIRANMPVNDDDLVALADRRALAVRTAIEKSGKIPAARVFLVAPRLDSSKDDSKTGPSRVDFALH